MHKLSYGLITLVLLLFAGLFWMERQTQTDLQHRLSEWTSRPAKINSLSIGLFESEITDISIPTDGTSRFTNDIEVGSINIKYYPSDLTDDLTVLKSVAVNRLTIHWNGLLGKNIHELINQVRSSFPKRRQRPKEPSDSSIQINKLTLYNTTIFVHIRGRTETLQFPILELHDVEGTHQRIIKQIVEQLQAGVAER